MNVRKPAVLAGVLGVFFSVTGAAETRVPQGSQDAIPKAIQKKLDKEREGWAVAAAPACQGAATVATADIDFDQATDAAMVLASGGAEPRIVIALPRVIGDAAVHDLGPLSAVPGATHLVVMPLGTAVREPGAMFDDYLSGPTFAAASCEKALVAYVWNGYGFRARPLK